MTSVSIEPPRCVVCFDDFSSDVASEEAPIMSKTCDHSVCRKCVRTITLQLIQSNKRAKWASCPQCRKASNEYRRRNIEAFHIDPALQNVNRGMCALIEDMAALKEQISRREKQHEDVPPDREKSVLAQATDTHSSAASAKPTAAAAYASEEEEEETEAAIEDKEGKEKTPAYAIGQDIEKITKDKIAEYALPEEDAKPQARDEVSELADLDDDPMILSAPKQAPNTIVWNTTLAKALEGQVSAEKRANAFFVRNPKTPWGDLQAAISSENADEIYLSEGRQIVGLPESLDTKVKSFCEGIIKGDPELYLSYLSKELYKYMTDIQIMGGSFAILMAFYDNGTGTVYTTQELVERSSAIYGSGFIKTHLWDGQMIPCAYTRGITTLENHKIIRRKKPGKKGGQHKFSLTEDGKIFAKALLKHHVASFRILMTLNDGSDGAVVLGSTNGVEALEKRRINGRSFLEKDDNDSRYRRLTKDGTVFTRYLFRDKGGKTKFARDEYFSQDELHHMAQSLDFSTGNQAKKRRRTK